jgi:predicted aspartyl protease
MTVVGLMALVYTEGSNAGQNYDIPMALAGSGAFYIKANIDSLIETDMLLDTGSGYVSLSADTFDRVRDAPGTVFRRHITGVMADGKQKRVPVYLISELKLSEQCILRNVEVAVMKNANRDILGLSALKQMQPLTLQMDPPVLTANCG